MQRLSAILAAIVVCAAQASAAAILPVSRSQWLVSYVADQGGYCAFVWDSGLGQKVEFHKGIKSIAWVISDAAWNLPKAGQGKITIVSRDAAWQVTAKTLSPTSVLLSDESSGAIAASEILYRAMSGTADIELDFPGTEPSWIVPVSRIYPMHSTFGQCLARLVKPAPAKSDGAVPSPF